MSEHTPGPWIVVGHKVYAPEDCEHHPVADCTTNHTCREEWEVEANAKLIAAAPTLLNALKVLADVAERQGIPCDAARAAINYATGEQA